MMRVTIKCSERVRGKSKVMRYCDMARERKVFLSPKLLRHRGVALVWTAILLVLMILMIGLSLDTAKVAHNLHELQNAADAASLAGAQIVKTESPDDTRQFTHDFGFANKAEHLEVTLRMKTQLDPLTEDVSQYDILIGRWVRYNRTFIPTLDAPNAVMAVARRNATLGATAPALSLTFGPIAGVDTADAAALAVAWDYDSGGAGLICLSENAVPGLYLSGSADVDVDGGGIHVNSIAYPSNPSGNDAGANITGSALIDAGFINVVGGISPPPDSDEWLDIFEGGDEDVDGYSVCDETTFPKPDHIVDPVAANMEDEPLVTTNPYMLPELVYSRLNVPELIDNGTFPLRTQTADETPITIGTNAIGYTCTLAPGYYPYGISLNTTGETITLDPTADPAYSGRPIYIFGGAGGSNSGLYVNGGNLIGEGVTCYVTKSYNYGDHWGVTRIMGNGTILLRSPGDQLRYDGDPDADVDGIEGIAIWEDPYKPDDYDPAKDYAHLNGGGDFTISGTIYLPDPIHVKLEGNLGQCGNQILCGRATILGKAVINVNYDQRNQGESGRCCLVK